jgi:hypothetical protein
MDAIPKTSCNPFDGPEDVIENHLETFKSMSEEGNAIGMNC